jgi:hypothetical protein
VFMDSFYLFLSLASAGPLVTCACEPYETVPDDRMVQERVLFYAHV